MQAVALYAPLKNNETPQKDNSAMEGKPFRVLDQGYGHVISEHDTYEDAYKAMMARPGSKILTQPELPQTQQNRDKVTQHSQEHNPDVDGSSDKCSCGKN